MKPIWRICGRYFTTTLPDKFAMPEANGGASASSGSFRKHPARNQGGQLRRRQRPRNVKALNLVAGYRFEDIELLFGLDPLDAHPHAQRMRHGDDGCEKHETNKRQNENSRKSTIDLEHIDIQPLQLRQRG